MSDETEFQMPTPDPALKRLDFLVGKWELTGATEEGPFGPAAPITGWESYEWLEGGFFLVHRWDTRFNAGGFEVVDTGYEFYDYDPVQQQYRTHFFNSFGPYDDEGSKYVGTFEGDALVVIGPARITRRPDADGNVSWDADVPGPDGEWAPSMHVKMTRIS